MTEKEKMIKELLFTPFDDELMNDRKKAYEILTKLNNINDRLTYKADDILKELFKKVGKSVTVLPPFHCDYGYNIELGNDVFINVNCVMLDGASIKIGNNCFIAPNVSIFTAGHPIDPENRNTCYEYSASISIGNSVWIGGNSVINPGVKIGDNVVVGSGSVVTKNFGNNLIIAGNPARVIREITDEDKKYYFKKKLFKIE